nr:protein lin-28 homolog A [Columba livia]
MRPLELENPSFTGGPGDTLWWQEWGYKPSSPPDSETGVFSFFNLFSSLGKPGRIWGSCCGLPGWVRAGWAGGITSPPAPRLSRSVGLSPGEKPGEEPVGDSPKAENESQPLHGSGICKWFNVRMGFGFLSMTAKGGATLDSPVDVFVHQSKLHMEGFRSLKEGEAVEFTFKKSSKGLESIRVTGPGGVFCIGSERRPKGKSLQKRRSKGDRCYNCGGLDHHAKECKLPPQPKKCHFCQSISHMVANCPAKAQQSPSSQGKPAYFREEEDMHGSALLPETRE